MKCGIYFVAICSIFSMRGATTVPEGLELFDFRQQTDYFYSHHYLSRISRDFFAHNRCILPVLYDTPCRGRLVRECNYLAGAYERFAKNKALFLLEKHRAMRLRLFAQKVVERFAVAQLTAPLMIGQ